LRQRARPEELAPLIDAVASHVRATSIERGKQSGHWTVYHLIDRGMASAYRQDLEAALVAQPMLRVHIGGPAPCYAFAPST
jgi:hypothetical protein